jgi:DNA-binding PadR family transcriptional regulator
MLYVRARVLSEQDYLVLVSLSAQPLHGYAVTQQIRQLTSDAIILSPGTLYKALDRMLAAGWVEVAGEEIVNSRLRRNYQLTDVGRAVLVGEARRRSGVEKEVHRRLRTLALGESS